jgi:hypothetical protein
MTATVVTFPDAITRSWSNAERATLVKLWGTYRGLPGFSARLDYATDQGDPVCSFLRDDGIAQITIAKCEGAYVVTAHDGSEGDRGVPRAVDG